jgi:hypothetical protein
MGWIGADAELIRLALSLSVVLVLELPSRGPGRVLIGRQQEWKSRCGVAIQLVGRDLSVVVLVSWLGERGDGRS